MNKNILGTFIAILFSALTLLAQPSQGPRSFSPAANVPGRTSTNATHDFASDLAVVSDAQQQAIEQAREMLSSGEGVRDRTALEDAIKQMERAQTALEAARKSPDKLPAALAAEQAAYQALLKVTPREYRMTRSRNANQGGGAGQASQRQMNELDMPREENRYETERQAAAPQSAQQREQLQTANRLKELAQRQQDLNERLRELQTALQAANTDKEREDLQRQLKRLQDEQRQMLANVDELRQKLEQSPNASSQAETQKQLEQTRTDMERAAQEMERQSPSGALAAGTRAQDRMQNLRDDLRKQTSSQFAEQLRQMRNEARDLTKQQDEIARALESLNKGEHQALDNSAERQQIVQQMERQQNSLTNLLSQMRGVTEQAEATEPLLSKQLYDTLRRADQMHTENLLEMGSQLTSRGFLPQASQAERAARTNITELARSVERAAGSVLGSEADALRYAQKELDDLTRQVEREISGARTNAAGDMGTNSTAQANGNSTDQQASAAGSNSPGHRVGQKNSASPGQNENRGGQADGNGQNSGQDSAENPQSGQSQAEGRTQDPANAGNNPGGGNRPRANSQPANNNSSGTTGGAQASGGDTGGGGGDLLRQFAVQLGRAPDDGGPITGDNYVNWADRLRDVEQALDPTDLRNQLATVRERASALRGEYRERGKMPDADVVRKQLLVPLTQVRVWLQEELARKEKSDNLVPLDRDPVPQNYSELVRRYYEKLGSAQ